MQTAINASIEEIRKSLQAHFEFEFLMHGLGGERPYRVVPHDDPHCFTLVALKKKPDSSKENPMNTYHRIPFDNHTYSNHELAQERIRMERMLNIMAARSHPFPLVTAGPRISHFIVTLHDIPPHEGSGKMEWKVRVMHEL